MRTWFPVTVVVALVLISAGLLFLMGGSTPEGIVPTSTAEPSLTPSPARHTPTATQALKPTTVPITPATKPTTTIPSATAVPNATPPPPAPANIEETIVVVKSLLRAVNNGEYGKIESHLSPELRSFIREKGGLYSYYLYLEKDFGPIKQPLELLEVQQINAEPNRVSLRVRLGGIRGKEGSLTIELVKNETWKINRIVSPQ